MQMLQIFNEFAWLLQVGILDGVQGVCCTTINNLTCLCILEAIFLKLNKKKNSVDFALLK